MESNIYYQLAQTECALDRYKAKLFKKNLVLLGMAGVVYLLVKVLGMECKKCVEAKKDRDDLAEKHDATLAELNKMKQAEAEKTVHCDGHAKLSNEKPND